MHHISEPRSHVRHHLLVTVNIVLENLIRCAIEESKQRHVSKRVVIPMKKSITPGGQITNIHGGRYVVVEQMVASSIIIGVQRACVSVMVVCDERTGAVS